MGGKSERKPMPNGVKENQKAFSERIKSNGDLVLLERASKLKSIN